MPWFRRKQRPDSYSVVVVFERFHSDDDDILAAKGWSIDQKHLAKQIAAELQEVGYNAGGMAGFFQVMQVVDGDGHFKRAKEIALAIQEEPMT